MRFTNIQNKKIILGSASPRRLELVRMMGQPVEVRVRSIEEVWPSHISGTAVAEWLALEKARAQFHELNADEILITGDTVVVLDGELLEKPQDAEEAMEMLRKLSGRTHTVASGLAISEKNKSPWSVLDEAEVTFENLDESVLSYYVEHFKPFDKAGAYGIQEWIGAVGVKSINGSFYTIMGLPVHLLFRQLNCS